MLQPSTQQPQPTQAQAAVTEQATILAVQQYQDTYNQLMGTEVNFSALVMGLFGVGKSTFLGTGRLPILIDSFDPRGTIVFHTDPFLNDLRESKKIIIRPYWDEVSDKPKMYAAWEKQWLDDCKSGFIGKFGTYAIDSGTTQLEAMTNYIRVKKGRGDNIQIQDYLVIYNMIRDVIKISSSQGADFFYTGHLVDDKNDLTGEITAVLDTYSRLKSRIPILFTEKYTLCEKQIPGGIQKILLTQSKGRFRASTQLGAKGIFEIEEEPNIKKLLIKAGLPTEDKPIPWAK